MQRKRVLLLTFLLLTVVLLTACETHSSVSLTYQVETGDNIEVSLDTKDGYTLTQKDNMFVVSNGADEILHGVFLLPEMYQQYDNIIHSDEGISILEESTQDNNDYIFYQFTGEAGLEHTFLLHVAGSNTGVLIGSLLPQEDALEAFSRLHFEKTE